MWSEQWLLVQHLLLYFFLCNVVYLSALSRDEIAFATNDRVAVAAAEKIMGNTGTIIMAVLVMISTFLVVSTDLFCPEHVCFRQWRKMDYFLAQLLKIIRIMCRRSLYGYRESGHHYCVLADSMETFWI